MTHQRLVRFHQELFAQKHCMHSRPMLHRIRWSWQNYWLSYTQQTICFITESTYKLWDEHVFSTCNVTGHILYHGPREQIMRFFQGLGFDKPERKGIPDFLQEVSGLKDQEVSVKSLLVSTLQHRLYWECRCTFKPFMPTCLQRHQLQIDQKQNDYAIVRCDT